jgi:hypothetical protein
MNNICDFKLLFIINLHKKFFQMENSLPPIKEMYNSTRENRDFNVIRKYQDFSKTQQMKKSPTKKNHYLDA